MKEPSDLENLYPMLSAHQIQEADENLTAYLALVLRIYLRLEQDEDAMREFRKNIPRFDSSGAICQDSIKVDS